MERIPSDYSVGKNLRADAAIEELNNGSRWFWFVVTLNCDNENKGTRHCTLGTLIVPNVKNIWRLIIEARG